MTPNQQTLLDLATRAEGVAGADRELDAEIAAAARVGTDHHWAYGYPAWIGGKDGRVHLEKHGPSFESKPYTASLDQALTLVPEGFSFRVSSSSAKSAYATVVSPLCEDELDVEHIHSAGGHGPALALTAAALRARATCAS